MRPNEKTKVVVIMVDMNLNALTAAVEDIVWELGVAQKTWSLELPESTNVSGQRNGNWITKAETST